MNIEKRKQFDDIVCDELNVKNYIRHIGVTQKGTIEINYNRKDREYTLLLDQKNVGKPELVNKIVGSLCNKPSTRNNPNTSK